MDDHPLALEKERISPVVPLVTAGLFVLFALGFLYRVVLFLF